MSKFPITQRMIDSQQLSSQLTKMSFYGCEMNNLLKWMKGTNLFVNYKTIQIGVNRDEKH